MNGRWLPSSKGLTFGLGFVGAIFMTVFWALTGNLDPVLVAFFGSCIGLNEGVSALKELVDTKPQKDDNGPTS
jgi:hypothetical protein